jgi:hypothetical protein
MRFRYRKFSIFYAYEKFLHHSMIIFAVKDYLRCLVIV